jgi:hypothetical protein
MRSSSEDRSGGLKSRVFNAIEACGRDFASLGWISLIDSIGIRRGRNGGRHREQIVWGDRDAVGYRCIYADVGIIPNGAETRDDDVRRYEYVIADLASMADVIAAPEDDVVADLDESLQCIIFQNEAIFPNLYVVPDETA